jgi:hypothetical protein
MTVNAVIPAPPAPAAASVPSATRTWRGRAAGATTLLAAFLTLSWTTGQFPLQLAGLGGGIDENTAYPILIMVLAAAVTVVGLLMAPGSLLRRILAVVIVFILVVVLVTVFVLRISADSPLRLPFEAGVSVGNSYFMITLAYSAAWILARGRRAVSLVFLIPTLLIPPVQYGLVLAGINAGVSNSLVLILSLVVAAAIVLLARLVSGPDRN